MSDASPDAKDLSEADSAWLDELFGTFVEALTDGREVDLDTALGARTELRPRALELLELARQVTVRRPVEAPHFAGYELVSEIGRGGMGRVYCVRHLELGRIEALKTLPAQWLVGDRARTRFEREARAVASLSHPGIIPIYDVGSCAGVPYFTMEFIKGRTLAGVLDGLRGLGQESRTLTADQVGAEGARSKSGSYVKFAVEVVRDVARALAHAHTAGVVHRDVKPSNILLRADGVPMLFDFGLASLEADSPGAEALTLSGEFLGTPHYVSPEQAAGRRVTAATDVFSLGATLYELLTLERPFTGASTQDVLRAVQQRDPRSPGALNSDVPRDLETVCLTALAKEPARRYASMAAFADDLERFLEQRPVHARSVGPLGRGWRLMRRHPASTLAILCATLLLFGTPTALFVQARSANAEIQAALDDAEANRKEALVQRDRAADERDLAREITAGFESLFSSIAPDKGGREVRLFEVLDDFGDTILDLRPEVRAPLEHTLGVSYFELTLYPEAQAHLEHALDLFRALPEAALRDELAVRADLNSLHFTLGRQAKVLELGAELVAEYQAAGIVDNNYAHAVSGYASALIATGNLEPAIGMLEVCLERMRTERPDAPAITALRFALGGALSTVGRFEEALQVLDAARVELLDRHGARHPDVLMVLTQIGQVKRESGDLAGAEADMQAAVEGSFEVFGAESLMTITAVHNLTGVFVARGEFERALTHQLQAVELAEAALPELHPLKGYIYEVLSTIYSELKHDDQALEAQQQSLAIPLALHGEAHPLTIQARFFLGLRYIMLADGEAGAEQLEIAREQLGKLEVPAPKLKRAVLSKLVWLYEALDAQDRLAVARQRLEELNVEEAQLGD